MTRIINSVATLHRVAIFMKRKETNEIHKDTYKLYDLYGKVEKNAWRKALDKVCIKCDGTDYAGYYTTQDPDAERYHECQHLLLRKGRIIQIISYQGPLDIRDKMDLFVNEMNE